MRRVPKILFKYPSRGRREDFFDGLDSIVNNMQDTKNYMISCTLDDDDQVMHTMDVMQKLEEYKQVCDLHIRWGRSSSKIHAVNRDVPVSRYWDIIVVMSDDMRIRFYGFDTILRMFLGQNVGEDGGLIHIPDQDAKQHLATMYIATRKFYDRFGYIYHPSYKSLWCDNEIMDIARMFGWYYYNDCPGLIEHLNPAYAHNNKPKDAMFIEQQSYWGVDEANYWSRKRAIQDVMAAKGAGKMIEFADIKHIVA